jgi:hypothetical protein
MITTGARDVPYFNCSMMLDAGSVILPGNWGRIIRLVGSRHTSRQTDLWPTLTPASS